MSCAEFHAVAGRGPSSLAGFALPPSPGPVSRGSQALSPANDKPSPAADRQTDRCLSGQAPTAGSIFGSDVTGGESSPARDCQRGTGTAAPAPGGRAVTRAGGGAGGGARRWPRALRSAGRSHPSAQPPGADRLSPLSWKMGRGGAGRGGVEAKSNLPVIAPAYFAGGEMSH